MSNYDGREIANYVLDHCERGGRTITNLALQKVVYFCHVWSLIELGRPLIKHHFEAWEYGPVLPYLYREFKAFDRSAITGRAKRLDPVTGHYQVAAANLDKDSRELLEKVVSFYTRMRAGDLVELSHAEGGPWSVVWNHGGKVNPGMRIDDGEIKVFYSKVVPPFSLQ